VDVVPDSFLTPEANDGLLSTAAIGKELVIARDPTGDVPPPRYFFQQWRVMAEQIFAGGSNPPPSIDGQQIALYQGNIINAVAFYEQRQSGRFGACSSPANGRTSSAISPTARW